MESKLTAKQRAFCLEYLVDLNATKAAVRAGYSEKMAHSQGWENLKRPDVEAEISRLMKEREHRTEITADSVLRELHAVAMCDLGQAFAEDGSLLPVQDMPAGFRKTLAGVDVFEEFEGRGAERSKVGVTRKVRLWDKVRALELVGKHLGMFRDRVEHSGPNGGPIPVTSATALSPEQIAQIEEIKARREALKKS